MITVEHKGIDETIARTTEVLKKNPDDERALAMRGMAYDAKGDWRFAIHDLTALLAVYTARPEVRRAGGGMFQMMMRCAEAFESSGDFLALAPDHGWCHRLRTLASYILRKLDAPARGPVHAAMKIGGEYWPTMCGWL